MDKYPARYPFKLLRRVNRSLHAEQPFFERIITMLKKLMLTSAIALAFASPAFADPNATNSLNITQVNGNNDVASVTQIGGLTATQFGGPGSTVSAPNTAKITQTNSNNVVTLNQDSTDTLGGDSFGAGSIATISQTNVGDGTGETATVTQTPGEGLGNISTVSVKQVGQSDKTTVTQGAAAVTESATVNQGGNGSSSSYGNTATILQATGYGDTSAAFNTATINQGVSGAATSDTAYISQDGNYGNATVTQGGNTQQSFATIIEAAGSYQETAHITQTDAFASMVGIQQNGNSDSATATQNGSNDNISITQSSTSMGSSATVAQTGANDVATISQQSTGDSLSVTQTGNNHVVTVTQK